jgi:penicillin-binding protein 1A
MRLFLKICLIVLLGGALALLVGLSWFFFYSRDLPNLKALAEFAPMTATHVSDPCLKTASIAIPYDSIGGNLKAALGVAEAREDGPGVFSERYRGLTNQERLRRAPLSWQIALTMFCEPSKALNRHIEEIRVAMQLERRFSRLDLLTIFANRIWFGEGLTGVQAASQHFFHKDPDQLLVGEAALLAGLAKAPSYLSSVNHPDRAIERRNEVIDAVVAAHAINSSEAETAKLAPLNIVRN